MSDVRVFWSKGQKRSWKKDGSFLTEPGWAYTYFRPSIGGGGGGTWETPAEATRAAYEHMAEQYECCPMCGSNEWVKK